MLILAGKRNTLLDEKQVWNECLEPNYETMTATHKTQARKKWLVCYPQRKMIKVDVLGEKLFVASVTKTAWNWEELQNSLTSTA